MKDDHDAPLRTRGPGDSLARSPSSADTALHEGETEPLLRTSDAEAINGQSDPRAAYGAVAKPDPQKDIDPHTHYIGISKLRFWALFSGILFSYLIAFFDSTLIASAHPSITSYFRASNEASWLTTSFYVTSTVLQPLYARGSDTIGRKSLYLFSISVFFLTTLWCGAAGSMASLIAARAMCGLGAGGVMCMGQIICNDVVKIEYRGIYQSYLSLTYGLGNALGAALGGFLTQSLGWRGAFYIQLPPILVLLLLAVVTTPSGLGPNLAASEYESAWQAMKTFDYAGSLFLTMSVSFLIIGINVGGNILPWAHPLVIVSLVIFGICSILFIWVEGKASRPVMPLEIISRKPRANLIFSNLFGTIVAQTILFNAPIFLQAVQQRSPTVSGLFLMSPLIGVTLASIGSGFVVTWTQKLKPTIIFGAGLFLIGAATPALLNRTTPDWLVVLLIIGASTGQGAMYPVTTVSILKTSSQEEQAVATTTLGLWRNLGAILGVAISSWVLQNALRFFLNQTVTGNPSIKAEIIQRVRNSIEAISGLEPTHRQEGESRPRPAADVCLQRLTNMCSDQWVRTGVTSHLPGDARLFGPFDRPSGARSSASTGKGMNRVGRAIPSWVSRTPSRPGALAQSSQRVPNGTRGPVGCSLANGVRGNDRRPRTSIIRWSFIRSVRSRWC